MKIAARAPRSLAGALSAALAAGCLSGSGHSPTRPQQSGCTLAPALTAGQAFTVSGVATYDFVPAVYDPATGAGGLDFAHSVPKPIRGADVQIQQCGNVLATATTDAAGTYSATFTPGAQGQIAVYVLARTANPPVQVQDNNDGNAIWTVGQPITSTSPTLDVHATHGWTGSSFAGTRIAAPFAILDDIYTAAHRLLDIPRDVSFASHPLAVNWGPGNTPGLIETSYYDPSTGQIWVLGADGIDTDEFDREVIVHEWGHYFEDNYSRSDNIGGPHSKGDELDPRVSFGEGYASAFAAMLLDQRIYADTLWAGGLTAFGWDVETAPSPTDDPNPGPFSELSVIRAMWDLYDDSGTTEPWDGIATGLGPIYDTLVGPERTTPALTTLASFVAGLKGQAGVDAAAVDAVLAHYTIGPIASEWGDGDASFRGGPGSIYTDVAAPTSTPLVLGETLNGSYQFNERPQNQYFVFTATGTQATVVATSPYDVDLYAYDAGIELASDIRSYLQSPTANLVFATTPGRTYVVALNGWGGLNIYGVPNGTLGTYSATVTFSN